MLLDVKELIHCFKIIFSWPGGLFKDFFLIAEKFAG